MTATCSLPNPTGSKVILVELGGAPPMLLPPRIARNLADRILIDGDIATISHGLSVWKIPAKDGDHLRTQLRILANILDPPPDTNPPQ